MAYVWCGQLNFTGVTAASQPLMEDSKTVVGHHNQPTVTISEIDYGKIYFRSTLKDDIRISINIDYIECGEGCHRHPYELPEDGMP